MFLPLTKEKVAHYEHYVDAVSLLKYVRFTHNFFRYSCLFHPAEESRLQS